MIICPNCKHEEPDGSIFCSECGTQILQAEPKKTQQITEDENDLDTGSIHPAPQKASDAWITLPLLDSGQMLPINDRTEFTLGRVSENQPIMPDVDMTPYRAYDHGVSRLHAVIKSINGQTIVMDLGSSNGTYLNGTRLTPNVENPLRHGDVVALGKLKMQIILSA
ncbi:MAG: FHA domain-containing protein [Anaerolineales bacterium]